MNISVNTWPFVFSNITLKNHFLWCKEHMLLDSFYIFLYVQTNGFQYSDTTLWSRMQHLEKLLNFALNKNRGVFRGGAKPPPDQWNLLISGGFQAPTGAEPPLEREKKFKPPLDKFLNTPLNIKVYIRSKIRLNTVIF